MPPCPRPVTLDDLIVLNDEIASLVRCGVPLELGLVGLGSTLTGRLGRLTARLASHLQKGASLPEALSAESKAITAVYRAVVEAGLRSGRLAEALASFGGLARSVHDLRHQISLALFYPTLILLFGYALFVGFILRILPVLEDTYEMMQLQTGRWLSWFQPLRDTVDWWGPAVPVALLLIVIWWRMTSRVALTASAQSWWLSLAILPWRWFPGVSRILDNFHRASFAHILRVLIEQQVPLPDALQLAGEATGNSRLSQASRHLADSVRAGRSLSDALAEPVARRNLPSFLRWMLSVGGRQATLDASLNQLTEVYRRRALFQAEWVRIVLPVTALIVVGGSVVLAYALTLFVPLTQMLADLGTE
jgi:general secretion pathway protein F